MEEEEEEEGGGEGANLCSHLVVLNLPSVGLLRDGDDQKNQSQRLLN